MRVDPLISALLTVAQYYRTDRHGAELDQGSSPHRCCCWAPPQLDIRKACLCRGTRPSEETPARTLRCGGFTAP
ncbi:hypothetical protein AAFF_G00231510 [Aldrovandia affinis]|uniref:Uncharacterized protein n=1 Tax=Aldrovandia affinis TaxID=143900 RepID=A0AAD7RFF1_9TELE|nr:hypothetical protein AAFF_G00231510 [Aldrovandia affinis]